ncbi:hypothetical protein MHYP_G00091710 [Metynnis hypsauchen]
MWEAQILRAFSYKTNQISISPLGCFPSRFLKHCLTIIPSMKGKAFLSAFIGCEVAPPLPLPPSLDANSITLELKAARRSGNVAGEVTVEQASALDSYQQHLLSLNEGMVAPTSVAKECLTPLGLAVYGTLVMYWRTRPGEDAIFKLLLSFCRMETEALACGEDGRLRGSPSAARVAHIYRCTLKLIISQISPA